MQAIKPCEARIEYDFARLIHPLSSLTPALDPTIRTLIADRQDHLSDLFIALRDKPRPTEFESGLKGRKRRKLVREGKSGAGQEDGIEDFLRRYQDAQRCVHMRGFADD